MTEGNLAGTKPGQLIPPGVDQDRARALLEDFLARRSERTRAAYDGDLRAFAAAIGQPSSLAAVCFLLSRDGGEANAIALRFRSGMVSAGLTPATVNRRLAAVRSVAKLARTLGLVPWSIEISGETAKAYRNTAGPGRNGILRILSLLRAQTAPKGRRDFALFRLLLDLGLRRGELSSLLLEDVDLDAGRLFVKGKGRAEKEPLTLPAETRAALSSWIAARGDRPGALFTNFDRAGKGDGGGLSGAAIYHLVRTLGSRVGIKARPHGVRHTAITEVLELSGGDFRTAQKFSRHADPRTLIRYDDNREDLGGKIAQVLAASFGGAA